MKEILNYVLFSINSFDYTVYLLIVLLFIPILCIIIAGFLLQRVIIRFYRRKTAKKDGLENKGQKKENHTQTLMRSKKAIFLLSFLFIIVIVVSFFSKALPFKNAFSVFTTPLYASGKTNISLFSIVMLVVIVYVANIVSAQIKKVIKIFLTYNKNFSYQSTETISNIARYTILMLVFFIGLPIVGIDISSFVVLFSAFGIGIGFGLQDTIANYVAGVTINLTHIIKEGDRVVIKNIEGHVQHISLLNTVIRSVSLEELIVPNKYIINEPMQNLSHTDKQVFISCSIQISYKSDLDFVKQVLLEGCVELPYLYKKELFFRVSSFDESGITVKIIARIADVANKFVATSDLNVLLWKIFKNNKIEIPFPQRTLHRGDMVFTDTHKTISIVRKKGITSKTKNQNKKI